MGLGGDRPSPLEKGVRGGAVSPLLFRGGGWGWGLNVCSMLETVLAVPAEELRMRAFSFAQRSQRFAGPVDDRLHA